MGLLVAVLGSALRCGCWGRSIWGARMTPCLHGCCCYPQDGDEEDMSYAGAMAQGAMAGGAQAGAPQMPNPMALFTAMMAAVGGWLVGGVQLVVGGVRQAVGAASLAEAEP